QDNPVALSDRKPQKWYQHAPPHHDSGCPDKDAPPVSPTNPGVDETKHLILFPSPKANPSGTHFESDGQDDKAETDLLRQHAENSGRVSYQSLRNAVNEQGNRAQSFDIDRADEVVAQPDGIQSTALEPWQ